MKRIFLLKGLDCPNCSAKIEKEVGELDGVQSSVVNLMKQTLTINVAQTAADTIASQIETIVHSHEPDVEVSEIVQESYIPEKKQEANESYNNEDKKLTVRLAIGAAIYAIGMALTVFAKVPLPIELAFLIVSYVILGGDVVWQAVRNISKGRVFDEHFLMSVSTIGAFVIGEYPEAVAVMLFYQVGEFFQSLAVERSRKSISDLMDIRPDCATVRRNGELITISPESVAIGEIIIVKPGEKIPLDGMPMEIGAKLRQARIAAGLTQEQTAEALGVSRQSISNWENEKNYPDIVSVVRLSDLYAVSLDALLKEEAPMSDYLDYLEESTNTVRSRREQSLLILLCVYLGIWAVSVLFFWLLTGPDDAMGYGIVFLWLVLPVAAFVISLLIGRGGYGGRQGWLLPLVFGAMHMLAGYATFMLANMLSVGILRLPQPSLLLKGTIISAAGFWFGALTRRRRRQRGESGE